MKNRDIVRRGGGTADTEPAGYQFRFRLSGVFVRCLLRDASVSKWTHVPALGSLDAIRAYARKIVRFHLRGKPEASAWVVEIGPKYVRCQEEEDSGAG
ncbi:MAG: hypothetical protein JNK49_19735 [Planctomycetes bacterium]|nr:hypothetical protein [Planctomycetota bacterium]